MLPAVVPALLVALCTASGEGQGLAGLEERPAGRGGRVASLGLPDVLGLAEQALPPAPTTVVLETTYYGTVSLDHPAHLARRIHCKACHGPGPVRKIEFTPRVAHERCRGCHVAEARGPTECRGCHTPSPKGARLAGAVLEPSAGPAAPAAPPPPPAPGVLAALAAPEPAPSMRHAISLGGVAGGGAGLSAQVISRQAGFQVSHAVDLLVGGRAGSRTALLVGAGVPVPLPHALGLTAEAVAGAEAVERPGVRLSAAGGARLGLEWTPAWSRGATLRASVTGLLDLFQGGLATPACLYATFGMGTEVRRRRGPRLSRGRGRPCRARSG